MAKIRKNIIIQGFSGTLGDQLIIKQDKAGRTILAVPPTVDPNRTYSEAQQAQHQKFRDAATYAKGAKDAEEYVDKAKGTPQTPSNVAMADWFHAPEIKEIDVTAWHGTAGQMIRILAVDDVKVTQVTVVITDGAGTVLEQGAAVQAEGAWWNYTTTVTDPNASRIVVSARDLPGHIGELNWSD
jgi:selenophosphate synthetase-related protein